MPDCVVITSPRSIVPSQHRGVFLVRDDHLEGSIDGVGSVRTTII